MLEYSIYIIIFLIGLSLGVGYAYTIDRIESYYVLKNTTPKKSENFTTDYLHCINSLFDYYCTLPNSFFDAYKLTLNEADRIEGWIALGENRVELDSYLMMLNGEFALEKAIRELNQKTQL